MYQAVSYPTSFEATDKRSVLSTCQPWAGPLPWDYFLGLTANIVFPDDKQNSDY